MVDVNRIVDSGVKDVKDIHGTLFRMQSVENLKLLRVGKPSGFPKHVDPDGRIRWHMESKMNVIDLIPCSYMIPLTKAYQAITEDGDSTSLVDPLTPHLSYGEAVKEFQSITKSYGLGEEYGGIRLYLTDETTSTDDFSNSYTENFLSSKFNSLVDKTKTMREIGRSVSSNWDISARKYGAKYGGKAAESVGEFIEMFSETATDANLSGKLKELGAAVGTAVLAGNRISLPKLWSDSNYNPNVSAVVKLVSPYGHPDAISEFIIKPLMFLLILASPRTSDGISYGQTPKVTVKGYGMVHLPLAHIANINLRKGGADTSYNIYRQPLSIDVSLQFESLVNGFAVYTDKNKMGETSENFFNETKKITLDINNARARKQSFIPTLGTIVDSLRPIAINKIVTKHNIQDLPTNPGLQLASIDNLGRLQSPTPKEKPADRTGSESTMQATAEQSVTSQAGSSVTNQNEGTHMSFSELLAKQDRIRRQRTGTA
jgi:hypothetical protein